MMKPSALCLALCALLALNLLAHSCSAHPHGQNDAENRKQDAMSAGQLRSVQLFRNGAHSQHHTASRFGTQSTGSISTSLVVLVPDTTAGPYPESLTDYVDTSDLLAAAIAGASSVTTNRTTVLNAIPFSLTINVYNVSGSVATPLQGATVFIWHCDAIGVYSAVTLSSAPANHEDTTGQKWLRGYQTTTSTGAVTFNTIIAGWYNPRFVHFHIRVRLADAATTTTYAVTTQLFPSQALVNGITSLSPYTSDTQSLTALASDMVYTSVTSSLASELILNTTGSTTSGYTASFNLGIDLSSSSSSSSSTTTTTTAAPATTATTAAAATTAASTANSTATSNKSAAVSTTAIGTASTVVPLLLAAAGYLLLAKSMK